MAEAKAGVRLIERTIPFPTSIGAEARAALELLVGDDGIPTNALHQMPSPSDHDGWLRIKAAVDAQYAAAVAGLAGRLRSSVETIKVDGATVHVASPVASVRSDCAYMTSTVARLPLAVAMPAERVRRCRPTSMMCSATASTIACRPSIPIPRRSTTASRPIATRSIGMGRGGIVVGDRSAGGNLAVAMLLRARDEGLSFPTALVLLSREVDLTELGDSFEINRMVDVVLPGSPQPTRCGPKCAPNAATRSHC